MARTLMTTRRPTLRPVRPIVTPAHTTGLEWEQVKSDTVDSFAYVAPYRDLILRFRSGGVYWYKDVEPGLVAQLRKPHPWRHVGTAIKEHEFERLAAIRTSPRKARAKKAASK